MGKLARQEGLKQRREAEGLGIITTLAGWLRTADIASTALDRPFLALAESCGLSPVTLLSERGRAAEPMLGLNAATRALEDVRSAGILDATKTLVFAIDVAFSYARAVLKTDAWSVNPVAAEESSLPSESQFSV